MGRRAALGLALALASGCAAPAPTERLTAVPVRQGAFVADVRIQAVVKPLDAVGLTLPPGLNGGSLAMLAPEGLRVHKGQVVAQIAERRSLEQFNDAKDELADQLRQAETEKAERKTKSLEIDQDVLAKRRAWRQAALKLAQAEAGGTPDQRAAATRDRRLAELALADSPVAKQRGLVDVGAVPRADLEKAELDDALARIDRDRAVLLVARLAPGGDANAVAEARAREGLARAAFDAMAMEAPARKKLLVVESQKRKVEMRGVKKNLKKLTTRMAAANMASPVDGVVVYPLIWGWRPPHLGMQIWGGLTFLQVASLDAVRLEGAVGEREVAGVKPGAPVEITADGYPGRVIMGVVESVGRLAKERANGENGEEREPEARKFDVAVRPLGPVPEPALHPNMRVHLRILGARREQASIVPRDAIFGPEGAAFVWLEGKDGPKQRPVKVDLAGRDWVALAEPLPAGSRVHVLDPTAFGKPAP